MKITAYQVSDFKRLKYARIEPGERSLVVVGGKNGQGKSSLLDGLTAAFGGKRQTDPEPVRRGADHAEIEVELEGGLVIRRRINPDGKQQLELYDESGKRRSPQRILDDLVGSRFLDPLAFLRLSANEQRQALIGCVQWPEGFTYGKWLADHDRAFDARREAKRRAGELAAAAKAAEDRRPAQVPEAPDVADLIRQLDELRVVEQAATSARAEARKAADAVDQTAAAVERQRGIVERAQAQLATLEAELDSYRRQATELAAQAAEHPDDVEDEVAEVRAKLAKADEMKAAQRTALADVEAADRAAAAAAEAANRAAEAEGKLKELRDIYAGAWENAAIPIDGIDWDDSQVLLGGVPFQQASNAEQLRAALAIAMAMSPQVHDIWVKDGSLLDGQALELVREVAEQRGYRVWLERVGEGDPGAIIVREGELAATSNEEAA